MARARNVKPSFFTNDVLAECKPLARLLFIGLWCIADRAGRLEERTKRIKAEILPYDNCNIEDLLSELAAREFIIRYQINGVRYIAIANFSKHQDPHVREKTSTIPAPDEHRASTVLDPLNPFPDSPFLNPSPAPEPRDGDSAAPAKPEKPAQPEGVLPHVWAEWLRHRGKLSPVSVRRQTDRLAELNAMGFDPNAVILQSIERGWSGLFELKGVARASPGGAPTLAEQRQRNMDILTGKAAQHERVIEGISGRVGGAAVLAISGDLRQSGDHDVGGGGPARSAAGLG